MIPLREMGFEKCKNREEGKGEGQGPVQVTQSEMWQELCQVVPKETVHRMSSAVLASI